MTPLEIKVLHIMEQSGQTRVRQIAGTLDRSIGYTRHLLDYLTQGRQLYQLSRDTYQITPKGIEAVIDEYLHTLTALERRISKHLDDERLLVEEIQRLKSRKNILAESFGETVH